MPPGRNNSTNANKSLAQTALSGLLWVFAGNSLEAFLRLLMLVVLARLLTPQEFGVVGAALIVIRLSELFARIGVGPAIVQLPELSDNHITTGFIISVVLGCALGVSVSAFGAEISKIFQIEALSDVIPVLALLLPLVAVAVVSEALLQRQLRFSLLSAINVGSYAFGYGVVAILLAVNGYSYWSLVWAHVVQAGLKTSLLLSVNPHRLSIVIDGHALRDLTRFGFGVTLARVGNFLGLQSDNFIVARWLGAESLGLYTRAYQALMLPVTVIGQAIDRVLFPTMSSVQSEDERLRRAFNRALASVFLITVPLSFFLIIYSPEIVLVLLGPQWKEAVAVLQFLFVGLVFRTAYKLCDSLARAKGAVYRQAWRHWLYGGAVMIGAGVGQNWGLVGVAIGITVANALHFSIMLHLTMGLIRVDLRDVTLMGLRQFIVAAIVGLVGMAIAIWLRDAAWSPQWVALVGAFLSGVTGMLCIVLLKRFLGPEVAWVVEVVKVRFGMIARNIAG